MPQRQKGTKGSQRLVDLADVNRRFRPVPMQLSYARRRCLACPEA